MPENEINPELSSPSLSGTTIKTQEDVLDRLLTLLENEIEYRKNDIEYRTQSIQLLERISVKIDSVNGKVWYVVILALVIVAGLVGIKLVLPQF